MDAACRLTRVFDGPQKRDELSTGTKAGWLALPVAIVAVEAVALAALHAVEPNSECAVWSPTDTWCRAYPWVLVGILAIVAPLVAALLTQRFQLWRDARRLWMPVVATALSVLAWGWIANALELGCKDELPCGGMQQAVLYGLGILLCGGFNAAGTYLQSLRARA
jgi:hypothetical protein